MAIELTDVLTDGQVLGRSGVNLVGKSSADIVAEGADQAAAEILAAVKTVDGTGSGLDADLLDGQQASAFQPVDADLTALAAAGNSGVLAAMTASFTTAKDTKLSGIEAGADVTDAANVAAAGAVTFAAVYVHDGSTYQLEGGRIFIGPEDPSADGFTLADGDQWEQTP